MTYQQILVQRFRELANKIDDGAYGFDDDIDLLALGEYLQGVTELVEDEDEEV